VFEDYEVLIFGAILMLTMIFLPQGIAGGGHDLWQWRRSLSVSKRRVGQNAA
jgi:branched-chain amino acid transport system permease protein